MLVIVEATAVRVCFPAEKTEVTVLSAHLEVLVVCRVIVDVCVSYC